MNEIGSRVGAILRADKSSVSFFGYGTYVGEEIPPKEAGGFNLGTPNPKIELDNGGAVFGCECWWGAEEKIKEMIGDREIRIVDIAEIRSR